MATRSKTIVLWSAAAFGVVLISVGAALAVYSKFRAPRFSEMRQQVEMEILKANGEKGTRWVGPRAPGWVPLELISDYVLMAVIASEDTTFYQHKGIDLHELKEAIRKDIREKRWARGASTLTQQVIKNVYLSHEKTLWRKFREILWAAELERELSKQEILCFYLNMAEWGPGIYGIGQAATYYFGVVPARLSVREAAFLAMLLPAPRKYYAYVKTKTLSPWATGRVNQIISVMSSLGFLDETTRDQGLAEALWGGDEGTGDEPLWPEGGVDEDPSEGAEAESLPAEPPPTAEPEPETPQESRRTTP